jgi:cytochrome oxidase Cu insertion factor (SCO1/SenC/PrrC family)
LAKVVWGGNRSADSRQKAEKLFEQVVQDYGDVKSWRGTLADAAKGDLFELRNLNAGQPAPEIEGEDVEGRRFKLSDYRGKVVVIDFWGDW